eukprot:1115816-Amorphochlora_amoeboformis.AAC.1
MHIQVMGFLERNAKGYSSHNYTCIINEYEPTENVTQCDIFNVRYLFDNAKAHRVYTSIQLTIALHTFSQHTTHLKTIPRRIWNRSVNTQSISKYHTTYGVVQSTHNNNPFPNSTKRHMESLSLHKYTPHMEPFSQLTTAIHFQIPQQDICNRSVNTNTTPHMEPFSQLTTIHFQIPQDMLKPHEQCSAHIEPTQVTPELWEMLVSANNHPTGIPKEILEAKKKEILARRVSL